MTRIKDLPEFPSLDSVSWVAVDSDSDAEESGKTSITSILDYMQSNLPFVQSVNQSTGITVNNTDPNNPLVGLSQPTQDAIELAGTAVQPESLGVLAFEDQVTVGQIDATGTPNNASVLFGDGVWRILPGGGNMLSTIYDPQNISNDAFDLANHTGEVPPSSVNELGLTRRLSARVGGMFDTVADLIADTSLTYSNVSPGDIIEAQGFRYEVSSADDSNYDIETAGGVRLRQKSGLVLNTLTFRVPSDYATPQEALDASILLRPVSGPKIRILIESGYDLPSGTRTPSIGAVATFLCEGADYSHVHIESEDLIVETESGFSGSVLRAIGCQAPTLACVIDMRGLGQDGYSMESGSNGRVSTDCGVLNAGRYGFIARQSFAEIDDTIWTGAASNGVRVTQGSSVAGRGVDASFSGTGFYVSRNSVFQGDDSSLGRFCKATDCGLGAYVSRSLAGIRGADFKRCEQAILVGNVACFYADGADCSDATGPFPSAGAIRVDGAAMFTFADGICDRSAGDGMRVNGGNVIAFRAKIRDNAGFGVRADLNCDVGLDNADITGSGINNVEARTGARISATGVDGSDAGTWGFQVVGGGEINAAGATGTLARVPNIEIPGVGIIRSSTVTTSKGSATVPDGQTSVVVSHGLGVQPGLDGISVTPRNSMGNASKFWFGSITATTFTIFVDANPGTPTGAVFAWQARAG